MRILKLNQAPKNIKFTADVRYLIPGIKGAKEVKVGHTLTDAKTPTTNMISRFEAVKSMVFAVIYFVNPEKQKELKKCDEKTITKRCIIGIFA